MPRCGAQHDPLDSICRRQPIFSAGLADAPDDFAGPGGRRRRWIDPPAHRRVIERYHNPNTLIEDAAVEATQAGRPAFWKRTRSSNATVGLVCSDVNTGVALGDALDRWADPRSVHGTRAAILAELIPLNAAAEDALRAVEGTS